MKGGGLQVKVPRTEWAFLLDGTERWEESGTVKARRMAAFVGQRKRD